MKSKHFYGLKRLLRLSTHPPCMQYAAGSKDPKDRWTPACIYVQCTYTPIMSNSSSLCYAIDYIIILYFMMTPEPEPNSYRVHKNFVSHFSMLNTFGVSSIDCIAHLTDSHSFFEKKRGKKWYKIHLLIAHTHTHTYTMNTHTIDSGKWTNAPCWHRISHVWRND